VRMVCGQQRLPWFGVHGLELRKLKDMSLTQNKIDNFILQNVVYILWRAK